MVTELITTNPSPNDSSEVNKSGEIRRGGSNTDYVVVVVVVVDVCVCMLRQIIKSCTTKPNDNHLFFYRQKN